MTPYLSFRAMLPHIPCAARVDAACWDNPWDRNRFIREFQESNTHWQARGVLAEYRGAAVGLCLWREHQCHNEIRRLCVLPKYRRRGVGRFLLEHTEARITSGRCRDGVWLPVPERDEGAVKFAVACGYKGREVWDEWFAVNEAAWVFQGPMWKIKLNAVQHERSEVA